MIIINDIRTLYVIFKTPEDDFFIFSITLILAISSFLQVVRDTQYTVTAKNPQIVGGFI